MLNSINYVRDGRPYSLQAQGDFRGIAYEGFDIYVGKALWDVIVVSVVLP